MDSALVVDRLQFAFTITFHYLFPQLTMGLGLLIVVLQTMALRTGNERYTKAARFWGTIFGINFAIGVVTGIPMEFQFGTNWARFSRYAGGVIGQTLAMEGLFAFFLESTFLGLFLYARKRLGPRAHWASAVAVWLGSWLSGYFIVATNAWMQHPVGYEIGANGAAQLTSFWSLLLNPWAIWGYLHTMVGAVQTGAVVMAAVGAFYVLSQRASEYGMLFLRVAVPVGCVAALLQLYPTGDRQGLLVSRDQPTTLAAMEALFVKRRRRTARDHRPAEHGGPAARQPDSRARHAQCPDVPALERPGARARCLSARSVAGQYPAPLLRVPHHGRPRHAARSPPSASRRGSSGAGR